MNDNENRELAYRTKMVEATGVRMRGEASARSRHPNRRCHTRSKCSDRVAQSPPERPKPVPASGTRGLTFTRGNSTLSSGDRHGIRSRDARSGGIIDRLDINFWSDDRHGLTISTEVWRLMSIPLAAALLQGTLD